MYIYIFLALAIFGYINFPFICIYIVDKLWLN